MTLQIQHIELLFISIGCINIKDLVEMGLFFGPDFFENILSLKKISLIGVTNSRLFFFSHTLKYLLKNSNMECLLITNPIVSNMYLLLY